MSESPGSRVAGRPDPIYDGLTMKRNLVIVFLLLAAGLCAQAPTAPAAAAAVTGYAEIVYLQGSDLMVLSKGASVSLGDPIGTRLLPGDVLQTGPKTQAEILLQPRGARLRLSENTVLSIHGLSDQSTDLELLYGRLRSKVEKLAARGNPFELRASGIVAGVRGTDFGCDYVAAKPGAKALVVVYCFEGAIQVTTEVKSEAGKEAEQESEPVFLDAGAMATIETGPGAAPIETAPISQDIQDFWKDRGFSSAGTQAAALPQGGAGGETAAKPSGPGGPGPAGITAADLGTWKKSVARKNSIAVATIGFVAAGAAMQGAAIYLRNSNASASNALAIAGAACSVVGIPVLILSISIDPFAPAR